MKKESRRPNRECIKLHKKILKKARSELRAKQKEEGLEPRGKATLPNRKSEFKTVAEEQIARVNTVAEQICIFRSQLPILLEQLSKIDDPRDPKKIKYQLTVLMIYGILMFVYQMASRRETTRELSRPVFIENVKIFFPEIQTLPHNDTLFR